MSYPVGRETNTDFISDIFPRVIPGRGLAEVSKVCDRLHKDATHYRMDYKRRGVAAVFNQTAADGNRSPVESDVASLCETFTKLGFETEAFNDLDCDEVESALENLSTRDHCDCDCFVLVYLNRGTEGKLWTRNGFFDLNSLWGGFTAEKSPTLANKPKIFIVHGYREPGGRRGRRAGLFEDSGPAAEDDDTGNVPGSDRLRSYYIPDRSDFLIVLSGVQGVVCLGKGHRPGSLYIQTLCQHLDSLAFHQDIITILTEVSRQITALASNSSVTACDACKKQVPTVISLLIRILQFTDKHSVKQSECSSDEGHEGVEDCSDHQTLHNKGKKPRRGFSVRKRSKKINCLDEK